MGKEKTTVYGQVGGYVNGVCKTGGRAKSGANGMVNQKHKK